MHDPSKRRRAPLFAALPLLLALPALAVGDEPAAAPRHSIGEVPWDARAVEHLFHRAGFGVAPRDIPPLVERSPEEVVEQLLTGGREVEPFPARRYGDDQYQRMRELPAREQARLKRRIRAADQRQLRDYGVWWLRNMLDGVDPLRDRMALFWHGFFTTNARELRRNYEVVRQGQLLREHALESYADLLAGIVRDPAMIHYLDNSSNRAGNPNENFARELMELFSLGEGNYTEADVREVARALTGYTAGREGEFELAARAHDGGEKRILGRVGAFDGDDVVRILLEQEACARWVAGRIVEHLEGVAPSEERLARYAALLRAADYELRPMLRALLLDPAFYRPEIVGARVQGPIEYVVGVATRVGLRVPAEFVYEAGASLGQTLFEPPNVKGWEEGLAWITSGSLLQRGNVAGLMLGVIDLEEELGGDGATMAAEPMRGGRGARMEESMSMQPRMDAMAPRMGAADEGGAGLPRELQGLTRALGAHHAPLVNLTWRMRAAQASTDAATVDALLEELLAIAPPPGARGPLIRFVRVEREALGVEDGRLLESPELGEELLRRLAHLILSLPEAQLN